MDYRIMPENETQYMTFDIEYNGYLYTIQSIHDILFWKRYYASKGVIKHINHLKTIIKNRDEYKMINPKLKNIRLINDHMVDLMKESIKIGENRISEINEILDSVLCD
jgi:hypothetical protein